MALFLITKNASEGDRVANDTAGEQTLNLRTLPLTVLVL